VPRGSFARRPYDHGDAGDPILVTARLRDVRHRSWMSQSGGDRRLVCGTVESEQAVPSSSAAALTLPSCSARTKARSASARSARKRLGCQPSGWRSCPRPYSAPHSAMGGCCRSRRRAVRRHRPDAAAAGSLSLDGAPSTARGPGSLVPPAIDQERERASGTARRQRPRRGSGARPGAGLLPRPAAGPTPRPARRQGAGGGAGLAAAPGRPPARRHPGVRACDRPPRPGAHELVFMADLAVELRSRASACCRRPPGSAGGAAAPAAGSPPGP
jgi:hypothetical protein